MANKNPSHFCIRLLEFICKEEIQEEIIGDLLEAYKDDSIHHSKIKTNFNFIFGCIKFLRFSNLKTPKLLPMLLFKNYLKVGYRNLLKHKTHSLINGVGLSVGIAFVLLVFVYAQHEFSYDQFHSKKDKIYRVNCYAVNESGQFEFESPTQPFPLAEALETQIEGIEKAVKISTNYLIIESDNAKQQEQVYFVGKDFFSVFDFTIVQGNKNTPLESSSTLAISQSAANKYFGFKDAIGKTILIQFNKKFVPMTVGSIFKDMPSNSSLDSDFLLPMSALKDKHPERYAENIDNWDMYYLSTYVVLKDNIAKNNIEKALVPFWKERYGEDLEEDIADGYWTNPDIMPEQYRLQALTDIHLNNTVESGLNNTNSLTNILFLLAIAGITLLLAVINFMNITLARASGRAKEIGLRQSVGSSKNQIRIQFQFESLLLSLFASTVGFFIAYLFLPTFAELIQQPLPQSTLFTWSSLLILFGITLFAGVSSGLYPALVMARLSVVAAFKNKVKVGSSLILTRFLVGIQLTISAVFIGIAFIISSQLEFIAKKNLGYNKENLLVLSLPKSESNNISLLKHELSQVPGVISSCPANVTFGRGSMVYTIDYENEEFSFYKYRSDEDYIPTLSITLVQGRNFDPNLNSDKTNAIIVNEAFVEAANLATPIGAVISNLNNAKIIGVMKNYNFSSLTEVPKPLVLTQEEQTSINKVMVKIQGDVPETISAIKTLWQTKYKDLPFSYSFLDQDLAKNYKSYENWKKIIHYAALTCILIASLGLFGLMGIALQGRAREISIRKVLGASVPNLILISGKEYFKILIASTILAVPATYYFGNLWLENFAYRIGINWIMLLTGLSVLSVCIVITFSFHIQKQLNRNPIENLKSE